jgi:ketosteroid isomerase-like protein
MRRVFSFAQIATAARRIGSVPRAQRYFVGVSANIDRTRAVVDAWNRNDLDAWLELLDPDIEFQPERLFLDLDPVYRGHEGMARFWRTFHEPWRELRMEIEYIEERGDWVVVAWRFRATGRDGMRVDMAVAVAIRFRDGLAVQSMGRNSVQEAWQAIGGLHSAR